jgi:hypothetical protein
VTTPEVEGHRASVDPQRAHEALARVDDGLVIAVLERVAAARGTQDVAAAPLPLLLDLPGVRGVAVLLQSGGHLVIAASAGYDCGSMAPASVLPLDAGLPVTEAVRLGRQVVMGAGPSWVAVPFLRRRHGALLLSLDGPPVSAPEELARLARVSHALGEALDRAAEQERELVDLALLQASLVAESPVSAAWELAVRDLPYEGPAGGDVVLVVPDDRGGEWLLVADVCGSGLEAAVVARTVQATLRALAPWFDGPAALLGAADRALRAQVGPGRFVTAVAVRVEGSRLEAASAGHPPPLVAGPHGVTVLDLEPGPPLALETGPPPRCEEVTVLLPDDPVLVLHTDGLLDRRGPEGPQAADLPALLDGLPRDDLEALADATLAAAAELGVAGDDISLLLARPRR